VLTASRTHLLDNRFQHRCQHQCQPRLHR
jgi:hypothetical protein